MSPGNETSAFSVESALVALLSLTNSVRALAAELLHAVGEAGERLQAAGDVGSGERLGQRQQRGAGGAGVLGVVRPAQRADAGESAISVVRPAARSTTLVPSTPTSQSAPARAEMRSTASAPLVARRLSAIARQ